MPDINSFIAFNVCIRVNTMRKLNCIPFFIVSYGCVIIIIIAFRLSPKTRMIWWCINLPWHLYISYEHTENRQRGSKKMKTIRENVKWQTVLLFISFPLSLSQFSTRLGSTGAHHSNSTSKGYFSHRTSFFLCSFHWYLSTVQFYFSTE